MWRSLVSRLNGVQEAAGSNPVTRTKNSSDSHESELFLFYTVAAFCVSDPRGFSLEPDSEGDEPHVIGSSKDEGRNTYEVDTTCDSMLSVRSTFYGRDLSDADQCKRC